MEPTAAYEALAPLHWDAEEFDFGVASEEDEPETEGEEDLQFLFQKELESSEDNSFSWEGADSSEEIDSSDDDAAAGGNPRQFLKAPMEGSEEGSSNSGQSSSGGADDDDSGGDDDDSSGDDDGGGSTPVRSPKRHRHSDTYD